MQLKQDDINTVNKDYDKTLNPKYTAKTVP